MIHRSLDWVAEKTEGFLAYGDGKKEIKGVSIDTRTIEKDNLFVPLIGKSDGHDYIEKACGKAGAALWQYDHRPYPDILPIIVVENTQKALEQLAKAYADELNASFIGITGSNGKTLVKDYLAALLSELGKTQKTQQNHNNEIGVPLTLLDLDEDCQYAIIEMGMEKAGELAALTEIVPLDGAIITSIGSAHLENFGSRENIARAKMEIAQNFSEKNFLLFNADSDYLLDLVLEQEENLESPYLAFGFSYEGKEGWNGSWLSIYPLSYFNDGDQAYIELDEELIAVPGHGFQAMDAGIACLMAWIFEVPVFLMESALAQAKLSSHRGQSFKYKNATVIDDSYKSNPESARQALYFLCGAGEGKKIAVLADMLDLGENTKELHEQLGVFAKDLGIDELLTYGDLGKSISAHFGRHFEDKNKLIDYLKEEAENRCMILVKGSRALKMEEVVEALQKEEQA